MGAACIAIGTFVSAPDGKPDHCVPGYFWCAADLLPDERHQEPVHQRQHAGIHRVLRGAGGCGSAGRSGLQNVTVGSAVFCGGAVVLVLLFKLRPAWLLTGFNSVLGALALFQPFTDFVGGMFSVTGIVYYLSVAGLFLFLTGQALERRRWN